MAWMAIRALLQPQKALSLKAAPKSRSGHAMSDDERAIFQLIEVLNAATKTGDYETILSLVTDDYILMVPGQEPMGKAAFAVFCKGMQGTRMDYSTTRIEELQVLGDWAYMRCSCEVIVTPSGCSPARCTGYTLDILRKQPDGRWLIAREANLVAL